MFQVAGPRQRSRSRVRDHDRTQVGKMLRYIVAQVITDPALIPYQDRGCR
jgi:hypothetical protein